MSERRTIQIGSHEVSARYADSVFSQARGHMFRTSSPDYALVFPHGSIGWRSLHMLFVPFPLDAVYVIDEEVKKVATMKPMVGFSFGKADTIIELPAGEYEVSEGNEVRVSD